MVRITTWNVNGIRNPFSYHPWRDKRSFDAMFDILEADIVIMQELKIQRKDLTDDMVLVPGWDCYFSLPKFKKGYSGVGIYTRQSVCAPIRAEEGLLGVLCPPGSSTSYRDLPEDACVGGYPTPAQVADLGVDSVSLDAEGRCLVLEFPAFVLFGVYSPANSNGLRDDFRSGFLTALDTRIRNLTRMGKRVVLAGDLNMSREEIDTARAEDSIRHEGITREDYLNVPNRRLFNQLLEHSKIPGKRDPGREEPVLWDLCREFHPDREGMYTHWEQKINARPGNFGSRIDFVLCSLEMKTWFDDANIQEGLMGSDHCPVYASSKDVVECRGEQVHILDIMNPPNVFKDGVRLREPSPPLPLSGRLLPEFNKRRNIMDMFKKTAAAPPAQASEDSALAPCPPFTSPSSLTSHEKRPPSSPQLARSSKRNKSSASAVASTQPSLPKGQKSLKGFFTPKPVPAAASSCEPKLEQKASVVSGADITASAPSTQSASAEPTIDPQDSKESWTKLFSKKPSPRCESHDEPCMSLKTKKPGVNCGRTFWICARPIGPSGQKENGTEWRCETFIWASDWNAPSAT
ncbi:DNase I-like protein [Massarina eburnea CBS 473.64]|uniref:DNA-(apurinic or apyrimidinic site) endonuclease 2 n=1 Tax=Massarina eburnea CBS 473.64 TaxID=1395130 RepID=A0A6A6S6D8_9PLEO|nr:DNase I-like protein [Massarina eburnea CBS 473.64]